MAAGRLHDPPASTWIADARGAQRLQAAGFRVDVIGFDIQVQARLVLDALHFDMQSAGGVA